MNDFKTRGLFDDDWETPTIRELFPDSYQGDEFIGSINIDTTVPYINVNAVGDITPNGKASPTQLRQVILHKQKEIKKIKEKIEKRNIRRKELETTEKIRLRDLEIKEKIRLRDRSFQEVIEDAVDDLKEIGKVRTLYAKEKKTLTTMEKSLQGWREYISSKMAGSKEYPHVYKFTSYEAWCEHQRDLEKEKKRRIRALKKVKRELSRVFKQKENTKRESDAYYKHRQELRDEAVRLRAEKQKREFQENLYKWCEVELESKKDDT